MPAPMNQGTRRPTRSVQFWGPNEARKVLLILGAA